APRPVGRLHLLSSKYGPEQDFWIYPGENVVGRLPSCRVCLPAPSVSKAHAVIEVPAPGGPHLLYDRGSLNRTRRQRGVLLPHVRYSLEDGDTLIRPYDNKLGLGGMRVGNSMLGLPLWLLTAPGTLQYYGRPYDNKPGGRLCPHSAGGGDTGPQIPR
uniref:FHA domain-containing protein n=1 Tax=Terrapene triunguis TaxID=2587831 RepID=A0A674J0Z3_9SAUR